MSTAERIAAFLERSDIPHRRLDDRTFALALAGEHRLQIAVTLTLTDDDVALQSFFMRAPQENRDAFYEMCLKRNARARNIAFAIDADGDVFLVGRLPADALDDARLDAWIGAVLIESDGMFRAAIEVGFASYLEADMAWRAAQEPTTG
jgi:hypothetical protein